MNLRRKSIGNLFKRITCIEQEVARGIINPDRIKECLVAYTELKKRLDAKSRLV
jgi:hypothetical protein